MGKPMAGIVVAMITPFHADESLDEQGLRRVARFLVERGAHGLFPGGSQGEFYALTTGERQRVLELTLEAAGGEAYVVAHAGATTTREALALARHAEAAGADAVAAITPFFVRPSQEELHQYYADLASAVSLPVLAYDNPGRTSVDVLPSTTARLARDRGNFVGIKDSSGDLTRFAEHLRLCPPGFQGFMGRDSLIYAALMQGGAGAVSATANVVPDLAVGIYEAVREGDLERAKALQRKLAPVRTAFGLGTFPVVVKEAMQLIGLPAGPARGPVGALSEAARTQLGEVLRAAGALE
jgi:4-hydroxy-tetrahydrodipicolinate synthase